MANVFTKRSKIPRSTTLGDYGYRTAAIQNLRPHQKTWIDKEQQIRTLVSPTRRQNPQPVGLVYQSPYNRFGNVFGIWDSDPMLPLTGCQYTMPHICRTNFSCKHDSEILQSSILPAKPEESVRKRQCIIQYGKDSIHRNSYTWPEEVPREFKSMMKQTRDGHTPRSLPAVGIAPNVINSPPRRSREYDESGYLRSLHPSAGYISKREQVKYRIRKAYKSMLERFRRSHDFSSAEKKRMQKTRQHYPPIVLPATEYHSLNKVES